uniref:Uncharacterized protein n=1 Tax=Aplanochytrium stocchinoi TaxID=215587 RepID=A0A7S3PPW0_9STRA
MNSKMVSEKSVLVLFIVQFLCCFGKRDLLSKPVPKWPSRFLAEYTSTYKHTSGTFAVDVRPNRPASERIYFGDSTYDHLCSTYYNHTPCIQLTTKGYRYLVFPEKNDCCKCCTYSHGDYLCGGPLSPEWVSNKTGNLIFLGIKDVKGRKCYKWDSRGLQNHSNFYYQFVDTGLPCEIDGLNYLRNPSEKADDQYIFKENSFKFFVNESFFDVPTICENSRYCGGRVCAIAPDHSKPPPVLKYKV